MLLPEKKFLLISGQYLFLFPVLLVSYFVSSHEIASNVDSALYRSLRSNAFSDATLFAVGVSAHLIAHLLLETLVTVRVPKKHMFSRWSVSLAYSLTNITYWITLRCDAINGNIYLILQSILILSIICGNFCALNIVCETVWNHWICLTIPTFIGLYFALSYQDGYFCNLKSTLGLLAFLSMLFGALLTSRISFIWYKKHLFKKHVVELDSDEKICFARICFILGLFAAFFCLIAKYPCLKFDDMNITFTASISYSISILIMLFSTSYARKRHAQASEVAVRLKGRTQICFQKNSYSHFIYGHYV